MIRTFIGLALLGAAAVHAQTHPATNGGGLFLTSDQCIACHSNLTSHTGEDVSIGYSWRASMMANAARDPYWQAGVRREIMDHPEAQSVIEDTCSTCHMPMARFEAANAGGQGQIFSNLLNPAAMDGVSCTVCHQIRADNFGDEESFDGGFSIDTTQTANARQIFGPHEVDAGRQALMQSAAQFMPTQSPHMQESELCATCHTLYTHAIDESGAIVPGRFAEQMPYPEWLHSDYRETQSCQSCHMPELDTATPITSVLGEPRPRFSQHVFRGGNAFMLRVLNRYRDELGVTALPQELSNTARQTAAYLGQNSARLSIDAALEGATLRARISVENIAGHKLPTAYPSRRAWLHFAVRDAGGALLFESGAPRPDGSIAGNDNDQDPARYEPHYETIDRPDQVQIYEPVLADSAGRLTTGLLSAVRYIKDNRLLPQGFDKSTATPDIAVNGAALQDDDFRGGGDSIEYRVPAAGVRLPLTVTAELYYQSIGFRWAENLKDYPAAETDRFVRYYTEMSDVSAVLLASDSVAVGD